MKRGSAKFSISRFIDYIERVDLTMRGNRLAREGGRLTFISSIKGVIDRQKNQRLKIACDKP